MSKLTHLIKRSWRESRELKKIANVPLAILFAYLLESGKTKTLLRLDSIIPLSKQPTITSYYIAHAQYLYGNYDRARDHLARVLDGSPYHADATYLLCSINEIEGYKDAAWESIIRLAQNSYRLKTWLIMANMVNEERDFELLLREWNRAISLNRVERYHLEVNGYISTGALRAGLYGHAIKIWEDLLEQLKNSNSISRNKLSPPNFSRVRAEQALLEIKHLLDKNKIEFFLVSGTLLGCVREGRILSHDKDVDIGVWDDLSRDVLISAFRTSGLFYLQASRSEHVIRVKHVNGTAIDVFIHYRQPNDYWHGGVKLKWSNTPFIIIPHPFLGAVFNIPKNYDLYLKENYGNWRIPIKKYDSSIDTSNSTIINTDELIVSIYRKLVEAILENEDHSVNEYLSHLLDLKDKHNLNVQTKHC
ncbi:TPA: tetratricopeptide repeat protein [Aeromonas salmonicida subsp. pectinolytica]